MLENVGKNIEHVLTSSANTSDLWRLSSSMDTFFILSSAIEIGLFDELLHPKSALEVARSLGLHPGMTEKLCNALASREYLVTSEQGYMLSDQAKTFFVESSPYYQGNLIKLMSRTRQTRWRGLTDAVKAGPIDVQEGHNVFDDFFSLAMAEGAVSGSLQRTVNMIRELPEFHKARKCLDLGGSHGLYSLAFTKLNPNLTATVFDLPPVIESVTSRVLPFSDRICTISGNFEQDGIGSGYDLIFASDVLYRHKETLLPLLSKIWNSLNDDGMLITKHYHIDDKVADSPAILFDLMFSIYKTGGKVYSSDEFKGLLESAGFSSVETHDISSPFSRSKIITARKIQKDLSN